MSGVLTSYIAGRRVGWFTQTRSGVSLLLDDDWRARARRMELSVSMPKSRREHIGSSPINFLWNLLPDNEAVLRRWGTQFSVNPRNPMALLAHVGLDTAGAIQLSADHDEPTLSGPAGATPISSEELAAHIRELRVNPEAWFLAGHVAGYFSLAGAQAKFALTQDGTGWAVPTGRAASTHIFKPGIHGLSHSDLNEHLTLTAAATLDIDVARSSIERFEDETVIVVQRYDRSPGDAGAERLHQEDFAQAVGIHPTGKYQNEGGPGIVRIAKVIRETRGREADTSLRRMFEATLFNWAILGTDAHAKNYSLLHDDKVGPSLAPLYDLATALPYPDLNNRRTKLAMSFGGHYRQFEIEPRHIFTEARESGLDPEWAADRARKIVDGVAQAYSQAASDAELSGADADFASRIIDEAHLRALHLRRQLDATPPATQQNTRSRPTQPRNRSGGKPGAFTGRKPS